MEKKRSIHGLSPCIIKMLKIMKLTVFLMLISFIGVFASETYSQTTKLTLKAEKISLEEFLIEIENQSEFRFFYTGKIDVEKKVSGEFKNQKITEILDEIKEETNIQYEVMGRQIILSPNNAESTIKSIQQQKSVSGTVTDEFGDSLPGVTVIIKGTTQGTVTNASGEYSLRDIPKDAILQFSFVGMLTQEIEIGNQTTINVMMVIDAIGIEEVVAIGYGVVKKSDLTGSVGSLKAEEIAKQPVTRVDQALQGRVSGVQVTTINGAPGTGSSIRIRGGNSINAGNEPLYVIDGFIGGGDLNTINPNDIESIEILKDASSTAIYGSRGSNGVILITTKRGLEKGFGVTLDSYFGIQSPIKKLDLLNGAEFAEYRNEYSEFVKEGIPFPDLNEVTDTDWQEILFRNVPVSNNNLTLYNRSGNSNYYVSLNYLNQKGIQLGSSFERFQMRFNFDHAFSKIIKTGVSLNNSYTNRENPRASAISTYVLPTAPVYNDDGSFFSVDQINGSVYNNPVAQDELISDNTHNYRMLGNSYLQITPFKDFVIKSTFGFDLYQQKRNRYASYRLPTNLLSDRGGAADINTDFVKSIQNENTINYVKNIGKHTFNVLGGWTYQSYDMEELNVSAAGFTNDVTKYSSIETSDPEQLSANSGEEKWTLLSALYRLNYTLNNKYLITLSGRHDGSSRLAEGNEWDFFPSGAFAWRIIEEPFMDIVPSISNLKFRISYGKTGSQSINPYSTLSRLQALTNYIGDKQVVAVRPAVSASPFLSWEVTDQFDVGIEFGFLNNRLNFELDYYDKVTSDLLLNRELSFQTGFGTRLENVGSLQNKGLELLVNSLIIKKSNFSWSSTLTMAANRNEVIELSGGREFIENGSGSRIIVGEPIGTFYGLKFIGLWQEGDEGIEEHTPGEPKFEDLDGDGRTNVNDGQIIGSAQPDFFGGLNNEFSYKNLSVNLFFDFSYGNDIYDLDGGDFNSGHNTNVYGYYRNRWTPENTNTDIPRAGTNRDAFRWTSYGASSQKGNSYFISDGSYVRLKNINIQYKIPIRKGFLDNLIVYSSATNVFTITGYQGFSPDVSAEGTNSTRRGFDSNGYPTAKTFIIGIKADF